ncbi:uncharacterized protein LOC144002021 isoform X2 [Festucalex cinctus]
MLKDPGGATRYHASEMTKFRARAPSPPPAAGRGINGIPSGSEGGRAHALASGPYDWTSLTTAEAFMQIDEGPILPFLMASSQRRCEWRSAAPSAGTFHPAASQRAADGDMEQVLIQWELELQAPHSRCISTQPAGVLSIRCQPPGVKVMEENEGGSKTRH